jgi:hypothetical protein
MKVKLITLFVATCAALSLVGCSSTSEELDAVVVPPSKADNYLAPNAQEYIVEGEYYLVLRDGDMQRWIDINSSLTIATEEEKIMVAKRLIPFKHVQIGWFLNEAIKPIHEEGESGGFDSLTKNGSYEDMNITLDEDGKTITFQFRQEIGGPLDLLDQLPTTIGPDDKNHYMLTVGIVDNDTLQRLETNDEWYRKSPWSDFKPESVAADKKEEIDLTIWPEPRSLDAWIDYNALFADDQVSIGVHFGWDYHNDGHLVHSKSVYNWLLSLGFESPVDSYDEYDRTSGPLTKRINANGERIDAKIWLYWGKPGTDTDPDTDDGGQQLEDDMLTSLRDREVIIFSGHSGPFYGFALANWRKTDYGDLDDSEIPDIDMPINTYQVVLAEGCETYAMGQAFWENPNKSDRNYLDIITTTSFSNASTDDTVRDFLKAIIDDLYSYSYYNSTNNDHKAVTYMDLLGSLDSNSYWFNTMYGIHGIDNNPHLHPYASSEKFCKSCRDSDSCGKQGYECVRLDDGKVCLGICTADDGCPSGWKCQDIATGSYLKTKACVPSTMSCSREPRVPDLPDVMINEILYDPPAGELGDANGDGERSSRDDEFVEIYNYGSEPVDVSGWQIADNTGTRFVFPPSTILNSGEVTVVFGGGHPAANLCDHVFVCDRTLGLSNTGDKISLVAADGTVVDYHKYSWLAASDRSLVRAQDGDPNREFVEHPENLPFSVCKKQDGSAF